MTTWRALTEQSGKPTQITDADTVGVGGGIASTSASNPLDIVSAHGDILLDASLLKGNASLQIDANDLTLGSVNTNGIVHNTKTGTSHTWEVNGVTQVVFGASLSIGSTSTTGIVSNVKTANTHSWQINSVESARIGASLMVGTTVDGTIGGVNVPVTSAFPGAGYNFVKSGVVYGGLVMTTLGNVVIGDVAGGSGGSEHDFWVNGHPVFILTLSGTDCIADVRGASGKLQINSVDALSLSSGAYTLGAGASAGKNLALQAGSDSAGVVKAVGGFSVAQSSLLSGTVGVVVHGFRTYRFDSSGGAVTATLFKANSVPAGTRIALADWKFSAATHSITVSLDAADTADNGRTSFQIVHNGTVIELESDGSTFWKIVGIHLDTNVANI